MISFINKPEQNIPAIANYTGSAAALHLQCSSSFA